MARLQQSKRAAPGAEQPQQIEQASTVSFLTAVGRDPALALREVVAREPSADAEEQGQQERARADKVERAADALLVSGGGRLTTLLYGLLPNAAGELVSYTVYRWECAIRASVVMGFVGAGGLGQLMDQAMKMLNGGEAATILLVFLALVLLADALSARLRNALD